MTKRSRGTARSTHHRPGTRPPTIRPRTATSRRPADGPTGEAALEERPSQLAAAAEIAEDVVDRRPAGAADELRTIHRSTAARTRAKPGSLLAARAATEYVYVAQDVRRIVVVSAVLFGAMIALWLLVVVLRVIQLPFY